MINILKHLFIILSLAFFVSACEKLSPPKSRVENTYTASAVTSVVNHYPADREENIATLALIVVKFSDPVKKSSVDSFNFRVEDESGMPVEGYISLNDDEDEIIFERRIGRRDAAFDLATTYTVKTRYIRNESDHLIAPYAFEFKTQDFTQSTGKFKITDIDPKHEILVGNSTIMVRFSEPVHPGYKMCSRTKWNDAFQILRIDSQNENGNAELLPTEGVTCLECQDTGYRLCDQLRFYPDSLTVADYILIRIRDTEGLRGISGERLDNSAEEWKFVVTF